MFSISLYFINICYMLNGSVGVHWVRDAEVSLLRI